MFLTYLSSYVNTTAATKFLTGQVSGGISLRVKESGFNPRIKRVCNGSSNLNNNIHSIGQACRKLDLEESPSGSTAKKKRPPPKTPRPKKKKTDAAEQADGGDCTASELGNSVNNSKSFLFLLDESYFWQTARNGLSISSLVHKLWAQIAIIVVMLQEFLVRQKKVRKNRSHQQKTRAKTEQSQMPRQVRAHLHPATATSLRHRSQI